MCCGWGDHGELGDGLVADHFSSEPAAVIGLTDAIQVSAGGGETCAVREGGSVVCWGSGFYGSLGDGTIGDNSGVPVAFVGLTDVVMVSTGGGQACALGAGGGVVCWGYGVHGELGDGTTANSSVPVPVVGFP